MALRSPHDDTSRTLTDDSSRAHEDDTSRSAAVDDLRSRKGGFTSNVRPRIIAFAMTDKRTGAENEAWFSSLPDLIRQYGVRKRQS